LKLLEDEGNMVLIFPQGKIESMHRNDFVFEKGAIRIAEQAKRVQLLFVANMIEYYSNAKPTLFMFLAEYNRDNPGGIDKAYNDFYNTTLKKHLERIAEQ
jgi:1-acyl-sn-glycerol-3-phosphate acyltransferase